MSAPAGLCESCGLPMHWTFRLGELMVFCDGCMDFFAAGGMESAGGDYREGREAVMPDGRPCRSVDQIVQDAFPSSFAMEGR